MADAASPQVSAGDLVVGIDFASGKAGSATGCSNRGGSNGMTGTAH
jgi:hypothetical protein